MWCVLCIGSMAAIFAITLLAGIGLRQAWRSTATTSQTHVLRPEQPDRIGT